MIAYWLPDTTPSWGGVTRAYALASLLPDMVVVATRPKADLLARHGLEARTDLPRSMDALVVDAYVVDVSRHDCRRVAVRTIGWDEPRWREQFDDVVNVEPIKDGWGWDCWPVLPAVTPAEGPPLGVLDVRDYQRMDLWPLIDHLHRVDVLVANCGRAVQECRHTGTPLVAVARNWTEERRAVLEGVELPQSVERAVEAALGRPRPRPDPTNRAAELAALIAA